MFKEENKEQLAYEKMLIPFVTALRTFMFELMLNGLISIFFNSNLFFCALFLTEFINL